MISRGSSRAEDGRVLGISGGAPVERILARLRRQARLVSNPNPDNEGVEVFVVDITVVISGDPKVFGAVWMLMYEGSLIP